MDDGRTDNKEQNHAGPVEEGVEHGALHDDLSAVLKSLLQLAEIKGELNLRPTSYRGTCCQ
jgi:hypothetical protein